MTTENVIYLTAYPVYEFEPEEGLMKPTLGLYLGLAIAGDDTLMAITVGADFDDALFRLRAIKDVEASYLEKYGTIYRTETVHNESSKGYELLVRLRDSIADAARSRRQPISAGAGHAGFKANAPGIETSENGKKQ